MDFGNIQITNLYSGSKGNCTLVKYNGSAVLIDAGRSMRALSSALSDVGSSIDEVNAVFVTHEHTDHTSALEIMSKKHNIPIHITEGSSAKLFATTSYVRQNAVVHTPLFKVSVGDMEISSFTTPHNSDMSVGYTFEFSNGVKFGYATDIGHITEDVRSALYGSDVVVLESNHDISMLESGSYPEWLKSLILSPIGHLSNTDSSAFLRELYDSGTKRALLAHLSAENNTPALALECAVSACPEMNIDIAREGKPTRLL